MTIKYLLHRHGTEAALEIQRRADILFKGRAGRYYQGDVTDEEKQALTEGLKPTSRDKPIEG